MPRQFLCIALLLVTNFLFGCTTKVQGLKMSEAMTYDALVEREIIAAGVVSGTGKIDIAESNSLSQQMRNMFKAQRKGIEVLDVSAVASKLGEKKYLSLLESYRKSGGLTQVQMKDVQKNIGSPKFLALARIDRDELSKSSSETSGSEYKDDQGRTHYTPGEVIRTHRRNMSVTMHIYDLKKMELAFTGTVTKSQDTVSRYQKNIVTGVVSIINAAKGESQDQTFPYPSPPTAASVVEPIFKGFAQNFPKKK